MTAIACYRFPCKLMVMSLMLLKQYFVMVLLAESCHNGCVDNLKVYWKLIKSCLPTALLRKLLQEEFLCWFQHSLAVSVLKQW